MFTVWGRIRLTDRADQNDLEVDRGERGDRSFFLLGHLNQVLKVVQDFDKEGRKGAATERVLLT